MEGMILSDNASSSATDEKLEEHKDLELPKGTAGEEESAEKLCLSTEREELFNRLKINDRYKNKFSVADFLMFEQMEEVCSEKDLCHAFMHKLLSLDYKARYTQVKEEESAEADVKCSFDAFCKDNMEAEDSKERQSYIHPMDLQMALFHCADSFLQQYMTTKLSQCQYALPLLVPNLFTKEIECPLWTFRQIRKGWKSTNHSNVVISQSICQAETPMVAVFRLGSLSSSKSQLLCKLINQHHNTFFNRQCLGSTQKRLLMDGVVEIAWYLPSGKPSDDFTDCIAFCNLHGDAVDNERQLDILTDMASVNIVFVSSLSKNKKHTEIIEKLYNSSKPLICVVTEDNSPTLRTKGNGKYKMGMKNRNQSEVSKELKNVIKKCLTGTPCSFRLEKLAEQPGIKVDEDLEECKTAKNAAQGMMNTLSCYDLLTVKEIVLPCQGRLWHDWCKQNKELYKLQKNVEIEKSKIQQQMKKIRQQQQSSAPSDFMKSFHSKLQHLTEKGRMFFLKWLGIFLDNLLQDQLSDLQHKYHVKWNEVLFLKRKHDKSEEMKNKQKELAEISTNLQTATFGLEHILREMGQIYEAVTSSKSGEHLTEYIHQLPKVAAELMISGHPIELMDGDAGHVPLTWITSVLDEVVQKLGDPRVFVLSVLGLQSTGKSTLLNTMFGLQFAVSAGRCTKGAFMQLMRVTDDKRADLKVDYVLVIDTEGLRALEITGKATFNHDNELATFVIGVGNMTLINILGENPSEIQDIIQIAAQAFMRMKMVNLSLSCVFVHQNVGDIAAGEKNLSCKRSLQEKLDEMTLLAAKEEECDAECFSDIIAFDIQRDVSYLVPLWEGSPPMAPPNPCYSENAMELKKKIISTISNSGGKPLSHFALTVKDLWGALLNEKFVFSFKNTLEISVHRKLEEKYGKWTWDLRSAILTVENMLHNNIENGKLDKVVESEIYAEMEETNQQVLMAMNTYFEENKDKEILMQWKGKFEHNIAELLDHLIAMTTRKLVDIIEQKEALKRLEKRKMVYEDTLFQKSRELAIKLKCKAMNENELKKEFDSLWEKWVSELTENTPPIHDIDMQSEVLSILTETHESSLVHYQKTRKKFESILNIRDYREYMTKIKQEPIIVFEDVIYIDSIKGEDHNEVRKFVQAVMQEAQEIIKSLSIAKTGYSSTHMQQIAQHVKEKIQQFQSDITKYELTKMFTVDVLLFVCEQAGKTFTELHSEFRKSNDASAHLQKMKPQYYNVFKQFLGNATSTAVLGDFVCAKLKSSVEQAVYDQAAIDLAGEMRTTSPEFSGNKTNLEKHILKLLAEAEDFCNFMSYIENTREYFEGFITDTVERYITTEKYPTVLTKIKDNIDDKVKSIIHAMDSATTEVRQSNGDIQEWLKKVCDANYPKGIVSQDISDFDFLEEIIKTGLSKFSIEFNQTLSCTTHLKMEMFRQRPDVLLKKHLCNCCWEKCPFCYTVCTNTVEGHSTDHSAPLHRTNGISGISYDHFGDDTKQLGIDFCTTVVASDKAFICSTSKQTFYYKEFRKAGPGWDRWSITPDSSELIYWKWFVCRFEKSLESYYGKKFEGAGEIPSEWREYIKEQAIESLENM
ncbi:interferon-induced very large GTPase 1-like [Centroberyx affinis]|uniref:interferon-induced very large GTPase 1-like n=1 Tax=Centroberyx affinis TaxID=166261 RepID=UPI003A5BAAED